MEKNGDGRENSEPRLLARRLSEEVGISEPVARDLIKLIGIGTRFCEKLGF